MMVIELWWLSDGCRVVVSVWGRQESCVLSEWTKHYLATRIRYIRKIHLNGCIDKQTIKRTYRALPEPADTMGHEEWRRFAAAKALSNPSAWVPFDASSIRIEGGC